MSKQLEFEKVNGHGGKRRGAGRKNKTGTKGHTKREAIDFKKPMHVTLKLKKHIYLRNRATLKAFRHAVKEAKKFSLLILHYSIQNDHIHMIIEAKDNDSLAKGMMSLCGRLGKMIRAAIGGSGSVFKARYYIEVLKNPTMMRNALEYVLLNTAKHMKVFEHIDVFSSGVAFTEWRKLLGKRYNQFIHDHIKEFGRTLEELSSPRSWLAAAGWHRARF
jgi:REP element-mobilizing transposase RayT